MSDSDDPRKEAEQLRSAHQTLLLSTVNSDGFPEISVAGYIEEEHKFYLFISGLAAHTRNLQENGLASIMFIEEESAADHPFGRKRLTYRCNANLIPRDADRFDHLLDQFENQFGTLIQTLRGLGDFQLFELSIDKGRYIAGFGKTFEIRSQEHPFQQVTEATLSKGAP